MSFAEIKTASPPGDWKASYEVAKALVLDLHASSTPGTEEVSNARAAIEGIDSQLILMEKSPSKYRISEVELVRRRDCVSNLRRQLEQITPARVPSLLLEALPKPRSESPMSPATKAGTRSLLSQHKASLKEQEDLLDDIGAGVGRLKDQVGSIHCESEVHLNLVELLDLSTDRAAASLQKEAVHAQNVRKRSSMCRYYLCIFSLSVVLVFLLVVSWGTRSSQ